MGRGTYYWVRHRIYLKHQYSGDTVPLRLELPVATCAQSHANINAAVRWVRLPGSSSHVGWGSYWLFPLFREVFLRVFRISTLLINNTTEFQFSSQRTQDHNRSLKVLSLISRSKQKTLTFVFPSRPWCWPQALAVISLTSSFILTEKKLSPRPNVDLFMRRAKLWLQYIWVYMIYLNSSIRSDFELMKPRTNNTLPFASDRVKRRTFYELNPPSLVPPMKSSTFGTGLRRAPAFNVLCRLPLRLTCTHPTSYFIGPYNLHYLLFSGKGALLCHHSYCFPRQSQTLFGIGGGQSYLYRADTSLQMMFFQLAFYLQRPQTPFRAIFCQKRKEEKISNFLTKTVEKC